MMVIDASVAAKWFLPEAGSQAALEIQTSPQHLIAPDLIRLEVAAAITRRARAERGRLSPDEVAERCAKWFRLLDRAVLSLVPDRELLAQAVKLSAELEHSLQDCIYLELALRSGASLITADSTFFRRVSPRFPGISMLEGCHVN